MTNLDVDNPQVPVLPPLLPLGALVLAIILDWLLPLQFLAVPIGVNLQVVVGAFLTAGGIWLAAIARRLFEREGTNVVPTQPALKIVTAGPYRFTRNPMYWGWYSLCLASAWYSHLNGASSPRRCFGSHSTGSSSSARRLTCAASLGRNTRPC